MEWIWDFMSYDWLHVDVAVFAGLQNVHTSLLCVILGGVLCHAKAH